jgi:2'-hydroxybiphenyl-2-sulfinate desulfinase
MSAILYYSNCPVPTAFLVAVKKFTQTLANRGLVCELLPPERSATHFAFDHPSYTRFGGEIPPLLSEAVRDPGTTRLIGLTRCHSRQGLLVAPQSRINEISDLAGCRIGITGNGLAMLRPETAGLLDRQGDPLSDPWLSTQRGLGTWEARALLNTLATAALSLEEVTLVDIANPWAAHRKKDAENATSFAPKDLFPDACSPAGNPQLKALVDGHVDAVFSFLPFLSQTIINGHARLLHDLADDPANDYVSTWTVSTGLAWEHPEAVQALVDVVCQAAEWAAANPVETAQLHADNLGLSRAAVTDALGTDFHRKLKPSLAKEALETLELTQAFLQERGLVGAGVDLHKWADPQFLEATG